MSSAATAPASPGTSLADLPSVFDTPDALVDGLQHRMHLVRERALAAFAASVGALTAASDDRRSVAIDIVLRLFSDASHWESLASAFSAVTHIQGAPREFVQRVADQAKTFLEHPESRVRTCVALAMRWIAANGQTDAVIDAVIESVRRNFEREENQRDASQSIRHQDRTALLHDTAGWKCLETSIDALAQILAGSGEEAVPYVTANLSLILDSTKHLNRFVRETALKAIDTITHAFNASLLEQCAEPMVARLAAGLADNWSSVRYAASVATRTFMLREDIDRRPYYGTLVPRMCLNRYYVAEGVKLYSRESWQLVMGSDGPARLAEVIDQVVEYYVAQSRADNHAVREAACHSMAELAMRMPQEQTAPFAGAMLAACHDCFRDQSWPVRDAACTATAHVVKSFPEASIPHLEPLLELWFEHISDNIWSVRENTAIALRIVVDAYGDSMFERVAAKLAELLPMAKSQPASSQKHSGLENVTHFGVAPDRASFLLDDERHQNQQMYSCGSLAPKLKRGDDHDHGFDRPREPWESSDGAMYLLRELVSYRTRLFSTHAMTVFELADLSHFPHHFALWETIWKCMVPIAETLGARPIKMFFELMFPPLFRAISCEHQLACSSAANFVNAVAKLVGYSIFRAKLSPAQVDALRACRFVDHAVLG